MKDNNLTALNKHNIATTEKKKTDVIKAKE